MPTPTCAGLSPGFRAPSRAPAGAVVPDWRWIGDDLLPDASLIIVARDAPLAVESFPFPWPPATALSALTAAQEEQRHAIARAARNSDVEQLNSAVLTAYGWPTELDDQALLDKLAGLNRTRSG